jgi:ABC-type uncharacterized transport system ATPase subunit
LEGNVNDIRKAWAANEYELAFEGNVTIHDNNHYSVLNNQFEDNVSHLRLKTKDNISTNDILQIMIKSGNIISFNPALPSMNEIFIRVVESRGSGSSK